MTLYVSSYSMDLGNGFAKRIVNNECVVEPSVLADAETFYGDDKGVTKLQQSGSEAYFVGDDVTSIGLKAESALGEYDILRYETPEFKKLFFGFIAKDFSQDVQINKLVTGLPVQHFKAKAGYLQEMLKGRKVVRVSGKDVIIDIMQVLVIPQPIGTYLHLVASRAVTPNQDATLIVDCGHGTLDVTELKGKTILRRAGSNDGAKGAYLDILNELSGEYGYLKVSDIPSVLRDGILVGGDYKQVKYEPEIQKILRKHFNSIFKFLQDNKFDLRSYNKVAFTGGIVHLYKDYFKERTEGNFLIVEDGQTANVRGYDQYGKAMVTK